MVIPADSSMLSFSGSSWVMNIIPMLLIILLIPSLSMCKEKHIYSASSSLIFTRKYMCNNNMGSGKIMDQHSDAQLSCVMKNTSLLLHFLSF